MKRPKSSNQKRSRELLCAKHKTRQKTLGFDIQSQPASRLEKSRYESPIKKWEFRSEKLQYTDPKSLRIVSAYQPKKLKKCLITNPKGFKDYYDHEGSCQLSKLSNMSFMKYLKEWRKEIRKKISDLLTMIVETDNLDEELFTKVRQSLHEIKQITRQMATSSHSIYESKNCSNEHEIHQLWQSFTNLSKYLKHLEPIEALLQKYVNEINQLMDAVVQSDMSLSEIKKKIKSGHKQCQKRLYEFVNYCQCHPESTLMAQSEFKLKLKFDSIFKDALDSLDLIAAQKKLKEQFQTRIRELMQNDYNNNQSTMKLLQEISSLLLENEQGKKYFDDQIQNPTKAEQLINKLYLEICDAQSHFLTNFKYRSYLIIRNDLEELNFTMVLDCLEGGDKRWKNSKKKFLLLSKIYSQDRDPGYYHSLSTFIKGTSESYRDIQQIIHFLKEVSSDRQFQSRRDICKILKQVIVYIQNFEGLKARICREMENLLKITRGKNYNDHQVNNHREDLQSHKIKRLLFLLNFSDHNVNPLLKVGDEEPSETDNSLLNKSKNSSFRGSSYSMHRPHRNSNMRMQKNQKKVVIKEEQGKEQKKNQKQLTAEIREKIKQNKAKLENFLGNDITQILDYSNELKILMKDSLVDRLLLFQEDLDKQAIHSLLLVKEFYIVLCLHNERVQRNQSRGEGLRSEEIQKLVEKFSEVMKESLFYKNCSYLQPFLEQMFETHISHIVMKKEKSIDKIIGFKENNIYPYAQKETPQSKYYYLNNDKLKNYLESQHVLMKNIVSHCEKYIKGESIFDIYLQHVLSKIEHFQRRWYFYYKFWLSQWEQSYYMGANTLQEWMSWQFMSWLQENSIVNVIAKRKNKVTYDFSSCLNNQRMKVRQQAYLQMKNLEILLDEVHENQFDETFKKEIHNKFKEMGQFKRSVLDHNTGIKYPQLIKKILSYLRNSNISHVGICASNEQPIAFLSEGDHTNLQSVIGYLQKLFLLPQGSIGIGCSKENIVVMDMRNKKQKEQAMFILGEEKNKEKKKKNIVDACFILDSKNSSNVEEEMNEFHDESFIEQIQESVKSDENIIKEEDLAQIIESAGMVEEIEPQFILQDPFPKKQTHQQDQYSQQFILPEKHQDQPQIKNDSVSFSELGDDIIDTTNSLQKLYLSKKSENCYSYLKLLSLADLEQIRFIQYSQLDYQILRDELKIGILANLFKKNCTDYSQVLANISHALEQSEKLGIFSLLASAFIGKKKYTKSQQILLNLKASLEQNQPKQNIITNLNALLSLLKITYQQIYTGRNGDKILLFHLGNNSYDCLLDLEDPYPFSIQSTYCLSFEYLTNLQICLLVDLIRGYDESQNEEMISMVENINKELTKIFDELQEKLRVYKQKTLDEEVSTESGVNKYLQMVTMGNLQLQLNKSKTRGVLDYKNCMSGVRKLLQMIMGHHPQTQNNSICAMKLVEPSYFDNIPILYAQSPQKLEQIISSPVLSLPEPLQKNLQLNKYINNPSTNQYALDIHQYLTDAINNLHSSREQLKVSQILGIIFRELNPRDQINRLNTISNLKQRRRNNKEIENSQDCKRLIQLKNKLLVLDNKDELERVIEGINGESKMIDKILEIHKRDSTFAYQDWVQTDYEDPDRSNNFTKIYKMEHHPDTLSEISSLLTELGFDFVKIFDKNKRVIGLLQNPEQNGDIINVMSEGMNIVSPPPFTVRKVFRDGHYALQIPQMFIYLISFQSQIDYSEEQFGFQCFQEIFGDGKDHLFVLISEQGTDNKPTKVFLTAQNAKNQIKILCEYPRHQLTIKFLKEKDGSTEQIWSGILSNYYYGQKLILSKINEYIKAKYNENKKKRLILINKYKQEEELRKKEEEMRKQQDEVRKKKEQERREQDERIRRQEREKRDIEELRRKEREQRRRNQREAHRHIVKSQGGDLTEIRIEQIDYTKLDSCCNSSQSSQISFTLSENAEYKTLRQNIKKQGYYKLHEIEDLISAQRKRK